MKFHSFIRLIPEIDNQDLMKKYGLPNRGEDRSTRCKHTLENGSQCKNYNAWHQSTDGAKRCYFHNSDSSNLVGKDQLFDRIMSNIIKRRTRHEEECSIQFYFDNFEYLVTHRDDISAIVEVGCYLGGGSVVYGQLASHLGIKYYVIEHELAYLSFTQERLYQVYPDCMDNSYFFHGNLTSFAENFKEALVNESIYLIHDAAHDYDGVVKDLKASHTVSQGLHSIAFHDTHLRSANWEADIFVDRAIVSVFGIDAKLKGIGYYTGMCRKGPDKKDDSYYRFYHKQNAYEGTIIPLKDNAYSFDQCNLYPINQWC